MTKIDLATVRARTGSGYPGSCAKLACPIRDQTSVNPDAPAEISRPSLGRAGE